MLFCLPKPGRRGVPLPLHTALTLAGASPVTVRTTQEKPLAVAALPGQVAPSGERTGQSVEAFYLGRSLWRAKPATGLIAYHDNGKTSSREGGSADFAEGG